MLQKQQLLSYSNSNQSPIISQRNSDFSFIHSKQYGPCKKRAKNDVADIQSAYIAITSAKQLGVTKLCINTESKLVLDAVDYLTDELNENEWLELYHDQSAVDRKCFEKFQKAICNSPSMTVKFKRVCSHNQHHDEADLLAKKGAERHCNYDKLLSANLLQLNLN